MMPRNVGKEKASINRPHRGLAVPGYDEWDVIDPEQVHLSGSRWVDMGGPFHESQECQLLESRRHLQV